MGTQDTSIPLSSMHVSPVIEAKVFTPKVLVHNLPHDESIYIEQRWQITEDMYKNVSLEECFNQVMMGDKSIVQPMNLDISIKKSDEEAFDI